MAACVEAHVGFLLEGSEVFGLGELFVLLLVLDVGVHVIHVLAEVVPVLPDGLHERLNELEIQIFDLQVVLQASFFLPGVQGAEFLASDSMHRGDGMAPLFMSISQSGRFLTIIRWPL